MYLISKSYGSIQNYNLCDLGGTLIFLNGFSLKVDVLTYIQTFCYIGSGGTSSTQTLLKAPLYQCWHTSFQLEPELFMHMLQVCHLVATLHQSNVGKIYLQYNIFGGIETPNILKCYITCLIPLKQCILLEETSLI